MKIWPKIIKPCLFLALVLGIGSAAGKVLNTNVRSYESTGSGASDGSRVLFFGTSQGANGINPLSVWDEAGIQAYNFCAAGQYIGTTYYVMEDMLNRQSPDVVVLDFESLTRPQDFLTISNRLYSLPVISNPRLRFEMYRDVIGEDLIYLSPLFRYHNRWKEITRQDSQREYTVLGCSGWGNIQTERTELPDIPRQQAETIGLRELSYLERIESLVKEKGCTLVLLDMPNYSDDETEQKTQWVRDWAAERGIAFCEANRPAAYRDMGMTPEDFYDEMHVNFYGQEKLSAYLGRWLAERFELADERGLGAGEVWEEQIHSARMVQNDRRLMAAMDMGTIFELLESGDYTVALSFEGDYRPYLDSVKPILQVYGIAPEEMEAGGAMVRGRDGSWLFRSQGALSCLWTEAVGRDDLVIRGTARADSAGKWFPTTELILERVNQSRLSDGINLLIYSHSQKKLLRAVGFDAANGWELVE